MQFHSGILQIDAAQEAERIQETIRKTIREDFRRKGAVVGVSGGVDSATVLSLLARALEPSQIIALIMPEKDSSPISATLATDCAARLGIETLTVDLTSGLEALGCYVHRDAAVKKVFPDYDPKVDKIKLALPLDILDKGSLNVYSLVLVSPGKPDQRQMLPPQVYWDIVAASNMKQRTRMQTLYHQAEKRNFAVVGTANHNEYAQGFFVKYGDGGADIQPIEHLYKTQVYQLARYLKVSQEIIARTPTSDTYSAESTQEEFYFRLPFELMDLIWYGLEHNVDSAVVAQALQLGDDQVKRVYRDLAQKARSTDYLRRSPVTLGQ